MHTRSLGLGLVLVLIGCGGTNSPPGRDSPELASGGLGGLGGTSPAGAGRGGVLGGGGRSEAGASALGGQASVAGAAAQGAAGGAITVAGAGGSGGAPGGAGASGFAGLDGGGSAGTGGAQSGGSAGLAGASSGGASSGGISSGDASSGGISSGGKGGASGSTGSAGTAGSGTTASTGPAETKPLGYGRNATGGGSKTPTSVATMADMQAAIDAYSGSGGLVLDYTGKFNFASITDPCAQWQKDGQIVEIKKKNDITIEGADGSAVNFGLHIAASSSNIVVRNMTFGLLPGGDASDAISIEGMSGGVPTDIWIDHNELFSSLADCDGAGDASFDGLIDMKKGADRVTVSYNYLHDHHKGSLNGFSDSDDVVRHATFHHNVFDNMGSRTPLQRHGYTHMLNNYFGNVSVSGINVRMGGYSLVEANFFEHVQNAVTSRDSDELGFWELRNNNVKAPADFATFDLTWEPSDSTPTKDATDWTTTAAFPEALGYTYTADSAGCVTKANLLLAAGAGKHLATLKCD